MVQKGYPHVRITPRPRASRSNDNIVIEGSHPCHGGLVHCAVPEVLPARQIINVNMKIKSIICSIVTVGLLAGGLTAFTTEREEGKEGGKATAAKLAAQAKNDNPIQELVEQMK